MNSNGLPITLIALFVMFVVLPVLGGAVLNLIPLIFECTWDWEVFGWGCFFVYAIYFAIGIDA